LLTQKEFTKKILPEGNVLYLTYLPVKRTGRFKIKRTYKKSFLFDMRVSPKALYFLVPEIKAFPRGGILVLPHCKKYNNSAKFKLHCPI
jgi:hypothetical protein